MVSLSLDGSTAEVHDNFRNQPGAFDGTMNAIRLFNEHGIQFLINSSFTQRNKEEAPKIYELVKKLERHRLVSVHDRADRPRRGYHGRADPGKRIRGHAELAL